MSALKINRFLSADGEFQPVIAKARELEALTILLQEFLPPELSRLARVANLKDGNLTIHAANGPAAAKLKMLTPSLSTHFSKQRWQVNSVSVRVQPGTARSIPVNAPKNARLSAGALQELAALYARLPDSPLRKALNQLLKQRGLAPADQAN